MMQIALRAQIQRDLVVLPKSNSPEHQLENISVRIFYIILHFGLSILQVVNVLLDTFTLPL